MFNFFLIFFVLLMGSLQADDQKIKAIPQEDFHKLESFFSYLMRYSTIGYVLCGNKPVAIEIFPKLSQIPLPHAIQIFLYHPGYSIEWNGWNVWKIYASLFPSKKFAFRFDEEGSQVIFVNKEAAKTVIEKNLDLFHKYLGETKCADEFLEELCSPKTKDYMVRPHTTILGILLGFGRNNAIAFTNKGEIQQLKPLGGIDQLFDLGSYLLPGCMVISNGTNEKENAEVYRSFKDAREQMHAVFENGRYFETFIQLFTAKD